MTNVFSSIEVDAEVVAALGARARPFIDLKPNDVLRRILGLDDQPAAPATNGGHSAVSPRTIRKVAGERGNGARKRERSEAGTRAKKGSLLDEAAYFVPILRALDEQGGRAAAREVTDRVGELLDDQFTDADRETLKSGGIRWQARVQFARLRIKERGLVEPNSPRGVWEISDQGREVLAGQNATALGTTRR